MNGLQCNCANKLQEINFKDCRSMNIMLKLHFGSCVSENQRPNFSQILFVLYSKSLHFEMDAEQMDNLLLALASVGVHALSIIATQNEAERTYPAGTTHTCGYAKEVFFANLSPFLHQYLRNEKTQTHLYNGEETELIP